jgi:galactokinase
VQCETAAERLGVRFLCDLEAESSLDMLEGWSELGADLRKRVRHVVSENQRVFAAVAAMRAHDGAQLGRLLNASHASLRDDFQVSTPEVDALVDAACKERDCFGARMTGGGFGGAIVALTKTGTAHSVAQRALHTYQQCVPAVRGTIVVPVNGELAAQGAT